MVSFKSATHLSPQAAGSAVMAHEQEHVSNAYKKASLNDGKVLQASVQLKLHFLSNQNIPTFSIGIFVWIVNRNS